MFSLILKRILWMIPTLWAISLISFALIQLPPGDYLTSYVTALAETGEPVAEEQVEALRPALYGPVSQVAQQYAALRLRAAGHGIVFAPP